MVKMWPPGGGDPIEVLPVVVDTMLRRGWTLEPPKPAGKSGKKEAD